MLFPKGFRPPLRGFTADLKASHECPTQGLAPEKLILAEICVVREQVIDFSQDVPEVLKRFE
jgi:hypothetical protein